MARSRRAFLLAVCLCLGSAAYGCADGPARTAGSPSGPANARAPAPAPSTSRPAKLDRRRLTRDIDQYLRGRPLSVAVRDLTTGVTYQYRPDRRFVTASCAKVDILMTLLLRAQRQGTPLTAAERAMAGRAIRASDNDAADRLWELAGGPQGVAAANRRFGLRHTRTFGGRCVDLYCWGITDTTATEQVHLLEDLVGARSPLNAANRAYVLRLMRSVNDDQSWGVGAAAAEGERGGAALKNGWQLRLSHGKLWAINSIGRVRTGGHDLLIAVLSDHHATIPVGIKTVEHVAHLTGAEFRRMPTPS